MANTADQAAKLTFGDMKEMVKTTSPALNSNIMLTAESVFHPASSSRARVLPTKRSSLHGLRPFLMAYDEVHSFNKRAVYSATQKGIKKTPNSLGNDHVEPGERITCCLGCRCLRQTKSSGEAASEDPRRLVFAFYNTIPKPTTGEIQKRGPR